MPTLNQYPRNIQIRAINRLIEKYGHVGTINTGAAPAEDCMVLFGKFKVSFGGGTLIINNNYKLHIKPIGKLKFDTQPDPTSEVRVNGAFLNILNVRKIAPDGANPIVWEMEASGDVIPYDAEPVPPPPPVIVNPTVVAPTDNQENYTNAGSSGDLWRASFNSTVFTTTGGDDTFVGAEWQISTDNTFSTTVTSVSGQQGNTWTCGYVLNRNTDYFVRVRHTGLASGTSEWSASHRFNLDAFYVEPPPVETTAAKPSMVTPATANSNYPTVGNQGSLYSAAFTVSDFALASGSDSVYASTEWQIATDTGFTAITTTGTTTSTSWTTGVVLSKATNYYVRARHLGTNSIVSEYSNAVLFNLGAAAPATTINQPTIVTPAADGTIATSLRLKDPSAAKYRVYFTLSAYSPVTAGAATATHWQFSTVADFSTILCECDWAGGADDEDGGFYDMHELSMPVYGPAPFPYPLSANVQYYCRAKWVAGTDQSVYSPVRAFKVPT